MYGILKNATNTGLDSEILSQFAAPLKLKSNTPTYAADTASLRRVVNSLTVQRWELSTHIVPSSEAGAQMAHSVRNHDSREVYLRMPQPVTMRDGRSGKSTRTPVGATLGLKPTVTLTALATSGTRLLSFTGLAPYTVGVGEFITFANHKKVYMVVTAGIVAGALLNSVEIYPTLRRGVPAGTVIKYGKHVTLAAFYDSPSTVGATYIDGVLSDPGALKFVESL